MKRGGARAVLLGALVATAGSAQGCVALGFRAPRLSVTVFFATAADRAATARVEVRVYDAEAPGAPTCTDLQSGAPPPDASPPLVGVISFGPEEVPPPMEDAPIGRIVVWAAAFDAADQPFLAGCVPFEVRRRDAAVEVDLLGLCGILPDGTACDDGSPCTQADRCTAGACTGDPRDCSAAATGPCTPGVCEDATGACIAMDLPDGASCDDGVFCTDPDTCTGGVCAGGPRDCNAIGPLCADGVCDTTLDTCIYTTRPDGSACADACVTGTCTLAACIGPYACVDVAPIARMTVTPGGGTTATSFSLDATATTDDVDAASALTFEWDFESDGAWDATGATTTHTYAIEGTFTATLRVTDSAGNVAFAVGWAAVGPSIIVVTTGMDVVDAADGETSLREAVDQANTNAGADIIVFEGPMVIVLVGSTLGFDITLGTGDDTIAGQPGVVIDGTGAVNNCLQIYSPGNTIFALEIMNCPYDAISYSGAANWFAGNHLHDNGHGGIVGGGLSVMVGPGNLSHENGSHGYEPGGGALTVVGNVAWGSPDCVRVIGSGDAIVEGNVLYTCNYGIGFDVGITTITVLHNTVHLCNVDAISYAGAGAVNDVRNNILSMSGGYGINFTGGGGFMYQENNAYFANLSGDCAGCTVEASALLEYAGFMDPLVDYDLRLAPTSPCIDAGTDAGYDTNGALVSGNYNGAAPDLGALEF